MNILLLFYSFPRHLLLITNTNHHSLKLSKLMCIHNVVQLGVEPRSPKQNCLDALSTLLLDLSLYVWLVQRNKLALDKLNRPTPPCAMKHTYHWIPWWMYVSWCVTSKLFWYIQTSAKRTSTRNYKHLFPSPFYRAIRVSYLPMVISMGIHVLILNLICIYY